MTRKHFVQLLNLYVDGEITPAEMAALRAEVERNPAAARLFDRYRDLNAAAKYALLRVPRAAYRAPTHRRYVKVLAAPMVAAACLVVFATIALIGEGPADPAATPAAEAPAGGRLMVSVNGAPAVELNLVEADAATDLEALTVLRPGESAEEWLARLQESSHRVRLPLNHAAFGETTASLRRRLVETAGQASLALRVAPAPLNRTGGDLPDWIMPELPDLDSLPPHVTVGHEGFVPVRQTAGAEGYRFYR